MAIRQVRIEGEIAFVPLTRGYEAMIDTEDVHLVYKYNWQASFSKRIIYARRKIPKGVDRKQETILMHRDIMSATKDEQVDHRNGNGLDNRRSANLRLATNAQNQYNRRLGHDNTSGVKGVYWCKQCNKWRVRIRVNGKRKYLGIFDKDDLSGAAAAYAKASAKYHGEFGRLK